MSSKKEKDTNSGYSNSGNYNSGNRNSGSSNSGSSNSGSSNSGSSNSGYSNSGNSNSGHYNSGDYNSGSYNSGFFNSTAPKARIFNKETDATREEILAKIDIYPILTEYKDGALVVYEYKEAWGRAWEEASEEDRKNILSLPNFDAEVFKEITGISVESKKEDKEVIILNGKRYKLID